MLLCDNYFPFASGPGASASVASWQKMARMWATDGVILVNGNQLNAHISGNNIYVDSGGCWIEGFYGEFLNDGNLVDSTSLATQPNGILVMRLDYAASQIYAIYRPNVSATGLNQVLGGFYEIPIAQIASGAITQDLRVFIQTSSLVPPQKCGQALQSINVAAGATSPTAGFTIPQTGTYLVSVSIQMNDQAGLGGSAISGHVKLFRGGAQVAISDGYNLNVTGQNAAIVQAVHCQAGDLLKLTYSANGTGTVTFVSSQAFCTVSTGSPLVLPLSILPVNVNPITAGFSSSGQLLVQSGSYLQVLSYTSTAAPTGGPPGQFQGVTGGTPGAVISNGAGVNDTGSENWFHADWISQA